MLAAPVVLAPGHLGTGLTAVGIEAFVFTVLAPAHLGTGLTRSLELTRQVLVLAPAHNSAGLTMRGHLPPPLVGTEEGLPWLMPPSRRNKLGPTDQAVEEARWLGDVAEQIWAIFGSGEGGMLVPCTSHAMVAGLVALLRKEAEGREDLALLASADYPSLGAMRQAALDSYVAGKRFIMLATGAAWTGFDLSAQSLGQAASEDNLLTDLVLPRLPFGMNRSITHRRRTENKRDTVSHEVLSVALLLQQALGRLVRRPDLPRNRRIYILDRRLVDGRLAAWISPVKRVIGHYKLAEIVQGQMDANMPEK